MDHPYVLSCISMKKRRGIPRMGGGSINSLANINVIRDNDTSME